MVSRSQSCNKIRPKRAFGQIARGLARLLAQSETGQAPSLGTNFWRAFSVIVLWERDWLCRASCLDCSGSRVALTSGNGRAALGLDSRGRLSPHELRVAGWAFDA